MTSRSNEYEHAAGGGPITALYMVRPTKWGNPYGVGRGKYTAGEAVMLYCKDLLAGSRSRSRMSVESSKAWI
jgi:hypothetical protein